MIQIQDNISEQKSLKDKLENEQDKLHVEYNKVSRQPRPFGFYRASNSVCSWVNKINHDLKVHSSFCLCSPYIIAIFNWRSAFERSNVFSCVASRRVVPECSKLCESLEDLLNVNGDLRSEGHAMWTLLGDILGQVLGYTGYIYVTLFQCGTVHLHSGHFQAADHGSWMVTRRRLEPCVRTIVFVPPSSETKHSSCSQSPQREEVEQKRGGDSREAIQPASHSLQVGKISAPLL